ncbi:Late embryogenesis abundant protein, LEA_2 subgroup [Dillenia turbinata]|uniref:Late embryogenesis abundant protein, LEA_2 subgroup n=1 Tax=Dillenia turbinata TaxID=194707 RepID=A0AAN8V110_9MAGN
MKEKECCHAEDERRALYRRIFGAVFALIILILLIILLIYLILRPTKPQFILQDATVFAFNMTSPNLLTSNLQVTLSSRNPNARIGIYYDRASVYASYRGQQFTLRTLLPSTYQGHKDVVVWSPFVFGDDVPVAPYLTAALTEDQMTGTVLIKIKVDGWIRWKVGTWISGHYHLHVTCPAFVNFGGATQNTGVVGIPVGPPAIKVQLVQGCTVDV